LEGIGYRVSMTNCGHPVGESMEQPNRLFAALADPTRRDLVAHPDW
jgi:hypothetical protein